MAHPSLAGTVSSPVPGVYQKPGVVWTTSIKLFVGALRALVPADIPLVVTSGERTTKAQAQALYTKRKLGDDLTAIYRRGNGPAIVAALLAVPNDVGAMSQVLDGFKAQGKVLSSHMTGKAVDLRSKGLTAAQVQRIASDAKLLGGSVLVESTPAHVHIGTRGLGAAQLQAVLAKAGVSGRLGNPRALGMFALLLAALGLAFHKSG